MLYRLSRKFYHRGFQRSCRLHSKTANKSKPVTVGYLTDLEGDYDCWKTYLNHSQIFERVESHSSFVHHSQFTYGNHCPEKVVLKDNCHFVFGGDLCDRNNGDLRLLLDFLSLKHCYPDRVHFILGNRDINKLRLFFSLQPFTVLDHHPPEVYWLHSNPELYKQAAEEVQRGDPVSKLRWILRRTMGSPLAFEHRQKELKELGLPHSDKDVVDSFLQTLDPAAQGGWLYQYLSHGKIAMNFGDVLFVHGAIHEHNLGWLPPRKADYHQSPVKEEKIQLLPEERLSNLSDWIDQINAFARHEIQDYSQHAVNYLKAMNSKGNLSDYLWEMKGGYNSHQPGSRLIQYGMGGLPGRKLNPTVIYSSYLHNGQPRPISPKVADWLHSHQIQRVVVGHQPNGDCPWTMTSHQIQLISGDSAYSKNVQWPLSHFQSAASTSTALSEETMSYTDYCLREGITSYPTPVSYSQKHSTRSPFAYQEILFHFPEGLEPGKASEVEVKGRLSDRSTYSFSLPSHHNNTNQSEKGKKTSQLIGRQTKDGWFIKATDVTPYPYHSSATKQSVGKKYYLLSKTKDPYQFHNKLVEHVEVAEEVPVK